MRQVLQDGPQRLITVADDFGLTVGINEAVEQAAANGILSSASLMVSAPCAIDAVARARRISKLAVGLHVVVIEGVPTLPVGQIPDLVDEHGRFPSDQFRLGINYFFRPDVRRQLAAEIRAQFEAFQATSLRLDHANAHKHMHLHPTVGRMMIDIGREFGLRAMRIPTEPPARGFSNAGAKAIYRWSALLRRQAHRAGLLTNDQLLGLASTGQMTPVRVRSMLQDLPPGLTEMYFHPASYKNALLKKLMPQYDHTAEFASLLHTALPPGVCLTTYGQQVACNA